MSGREHKDYLQPTTPRHARVMRQVLEDDIGLEAIEEALEIATLGEDPQALPSRERQLLERMGDPAFASHSLPMLMKQIGITFPEMMDLCRKHKIALAMAATTDRVVKVLDGLGEAAEPKWVICVRCEGDGKVQIERPASDPEAEPELQIVDCPNPQCHDGKVKVMGDLDAAKLFLGAHGVGGGKGTGSPVNVNVSAQAGVRIDNKKNGEDAHESVTSRVQAALEGGSKQ